MKLLIVESPGKVNTIQKYLGGDYKVIASVGHIRELSEKRNEKPGYNTKTFEPYWDIKQNNNNLSSEKVNELKIAASNAEIIYLATDPDREGEAISWHIFDTLEKSDQPKCKRISFNEITKNAIEKSLENPRDIDMNIVHSQWARRILDRFVGYDLSTLVRSKLKAISAGRVQTVVLLFIVERAKEISKFIPEVWWTIETEIENNIIIWLRETNVKDAKMKALKEKNYSECTFETKNDSEKVLKKLGEYFEVYRVEEPTSSVGKQYIPLQSDTMLSKAIAQFGWTTKYITELSQKLYSGINIDGKSVSLITYPRSDTNRLNDDFIKSTQEYILSRFGKEFTNKNALKFNTGPLIQAAHEGIRPNDITVTPEELNGNIKEKNPEDFKKLYALIWTHTISSMMAPPTYKNSIIRLINNEQKFFTSYTTTVFKGYLVLEFWKKNNKEVSLEYVKVGDKFKAIKGPESVEHSTKPKAYYNEGTLIGELKKAGVGRPSTYNPMLNVVKKRDYIVDYKLLGKNEKKNLQPTDLGITLVEKLMEYFPEFISKKFTAKMEEDLDVIADGKLVYSEWLKKIHEEFQLEINDAKKNMDKVLDVKVGEACPDCGKDLIYKQVMNKFSKKSYGNNKFIGCSGWTKAGDGCNYRRSIEKSNTSSTILEEKCPICDSCLIERKTYRGSFVGCSSFPKCNYIKPEIFDKKCPKCNKPLVVKSSKRGKFLGCSGWTKDGNGCKHLEKYPDIKNIN